MTSTAPAAPPIARSAAMERRLRQRRADARIRVKILSDCQLLAVHHASGLPGVAVSDPLSEMASLRRLLASLSQQLVELREEVKALRAGPTATAHRRFGYSDGAYGYGAFRFGCSDGTYSRAF